MAQKYKFNIHLYADDTQIYFDLNPLVDISKTLQDLKKCFCDIKMWMTENYLKINESKTSMMEFHSPYTPFPLQSSFHLETCDVIPTDEAKNLGFWFDKHLSLDSQIKRVSKTCYENLRKLGRIGLKLSKDLKIQLVHPCIHSFMDNYNATYFTLSHIQLQKLQKIQNAAVKFIFGLKGKERFQPITPFLKKLHFLPVAYRIKFKIALLSFKCINNFAPHYLSSLLSIRKNNEHFVRADNDFFLMDHPSPPRCSKTMGAFIHCAPAVWNALPYSIRSMSDIKAFKCALKTHLFKCAFSDNQNTDSSSIYITNFDLDLEI